MDRNPAQSGRFRPARRDNSDIRRGWFGGHRPGGEAGKVVGRRTVRALAEAADCRPTHYVFIITTMAERYSFAAVSLPAAKLTSQQ